MPAYAYAIDIKRRRQRVDFQEIAEIEGDLSLEKLAFVGDDTFDVEEGLGGYKVTVFRSRLETNEERGVRVEKEKAYMEEYERRRKLREQ